MALACDLRFCAADAYLAVTPAKLGLVYGHAETRRLVELVGPARAKDILFTGRRIETDEALSIGLIDRRVETALRETVSVTRAAWPISARPRSAAQARGRRHRRRHDLRDPGLSGPGRAGGAGAGFRGGAPAFAEKRPPRFAFRGASPTLPRA